ncbi:MAG: phage replisome organizer N-terminal domain-containing protein [Clostridia bacterium]|nr:phage replisome organizer N-terminal domain-containing protein [Clostridia bacterium]
MPEMKWIKVDCNLFDNRKIKYLMRLERGEERVLLWVRLLCLAGKLGNLGRLMMTKNLPFTSELLAEEFGLERTFVKDTIGVMLSLDMLSKEQGCLCISGWVEHQSVSKGQKLKEQNRIRKQRQRQNVTQMSRICHDIEENREEERRKEESRAQENEELQKCQSVIDIYNARCLSLSRVRHLSPTRQQAIMYLLEKYSMAEFEDLFDAAERSSYLTGKNERGWKATFDWLIKEANMHKVLEGNFDNASKPLDDLEMKMIKELHKSE